MIARISTRIIRIVDITEVLKLRYSMSDIIAKIRQIVSDFVIFFSPYLRANRNATRHPVNSISVTYAP